MFSLLLAIIGAVGFYVSAVVERHRRAISWTGFALGTLTLILGVLDWLDKPPEWKFTGKEAQKIAALSQSYSSRFPVFIFFVDNSQAAEVYARRLKDALLAQQWPAYVIYSKQLSADIRGLNVAVSIRSLQVGATWDAVALKTLLDQAGFNTEPAITSEQWLDQYVEDHIPEHGWVAIKIGANPR
jgi:hypothetical protein